jgi:hypothetical protein
MVSNTFGQGRLVAHENLSIYQGIRFSRPRSRPAI